MRKQLLSALAVGAIAPATGAALAADNTKTGTENPAASHALQHRTYEAQAHHAVHVRHVRAARKRQHRMKKQAAAVPAALQTIAACESHDNPRAVGGGGARVRAGPSRGDAVRPRGHHAVAGLRPGRLSSAWVRY